MGAAVEAMFHPVPEVVPMQFFRSVVSRMFVVLLFAGCMGLAGQPAHGQSAGAAAQILTRETAAPLFPATVFFAGQTTTVQMRNSAGVRFGDHHLMLAALVDTGGYSTGIQEKFQAYVITEVRLKVGDQTLAPGAYGFGFIGTNQMLVMDLGGGDLFKTATTHDEGLRRPTPLQILPSPDSSPSFRLYLGKNFVTLSQAH
jgi:hypothetical protein